MAGIAIGSVLAVLALLAGLRRGKAVYPAGAVCDAELVVPGVAGAAPETELLSRAGPASCSGSLFAFAGRAPSDPRPAGHVGPRAQPYGAGEHRDQLLVTCANYPIVHHLFLRAADAQQRPYSSSLPYRAGKDLFLIGALPDEHSPLPAGAVEFRRLDAAADTGEMVFQIAVASAGGRFRAVAQLHVGSRLPPALNALRFSPWNTGGDLEPAGWLNSARNRAYKLS